MGLIRSAIDIILGPWRLAASLDRYAAAQEAMLHDIMGVQRIQAETNHRLASLLEANVAALATEGDPEGRGGLSDEEELQLLAELNRADLPPKWGDKN